MVTMLSYLYPLHSPFLVIDPSLQHNLREPWQSTAQPQSSSWSLFSSRPPSAAMQSGMTLPQMLLRAHIKRYTDHWIWAGFFFLFSFLINVRDQIFHSSLLKKAAAAEAEALRKDVKELGKKSVWWEEHLWLTLTTFTQKGNNTSWLSYIFNLLEIIIHIFKKLILSTTKKKE